MFYHLLKLTLRSLLGNKLYSFINIGGLAAALASVILLSLYVKVELSYDRQWLDASNLYRVSLTMHPGDGSPDTQLATAPIPLAGWLQQDLPQIIEVARMRESRVLLRRDDTAFYEDNGRDVDASFFQLFNVTWLQGDAAHAFEVPLRSVVLTRSKALRYFGSEDPMGQTLMLENRVPLKVTGVIADLPQDTHLTGDVFLSMEGYERFLPENIRTGWFAKIMYTFVKVKPDTDMAALAAQLPALLSRHLDPETVKQNSLTLMPLADIHLHSQLDRELRAPGSFATVLALITVAVGILLIACFNFMNLATARSTLRGREVAVRKTIGAERWQLVLQFLGESIGMTLVATVLAVAIVEVVLPAFVGFTGKQIAFDPLHDHGLQGQLLALVLIVGLLAGSYPAFYLSSFQPSLVLRNGFTLGGVLLRNLLVILQFAISIALVIVTAVVLLQVSYAQSYDAGFNKEQIVVIDNATAALGPPSRWSALKAELLRNRDVLGVTGVDKTPGSVNLNSLEVTPEGGTQSHTLVSQFVDYGFFEVFDIKPLVGRLFTPEFPADSLEAPATQGGKPGGNFILNAAAARELGWTPESAMGKQLKAPFGPDVVLDGYVVGVVADSNFESIRSRVKPMVFMVIPSGFYEETPAFGSAVIRIAASGVNNTLAAIDQAWQTVMPEYPLSRSVLSDNFAALYQDDTRLGQIFIAFSALAIVIACLGLYGLATFNAQRRTKEIGIRKVMGGSVWSIVLLLTNDFSKLVLLSNLLAWPIAYYAMNRWLENFAYRIDLTPLIFIGSGLIALCIAWVTVGGTAAKAASQKPVLALRYE
jgi:putative ABC transport system permease protein